MSIDIPPNSCKGTKQVIASLMLVISMCSVKVNAAICNNNTNLPDELACTSVDKSPTIDIDHTLAIALGLLLSGGGYMTYNRGLRRKRGLFPDKANKEESIDTPSEKGLSLEPLTVEVNSTSPMSLHEINAICWEIVAEVLGETDIASELLSNQYLQQSAMSWINDPKIRELLGTLQYADEVHADIHHLLILIKNPGHHQKIGCLLYYYYHHIPLVQEYDRFFESCTKNLPGAKGNFLANLENEYEQHTREFNLSKEHLQSLKNRMNSRIEDIDTKN